MTALELLQQLVRIDTTNPPGNETEAAELLEADLRGAGLQVELFSDPEGRTSVVGRVPGPRDVPALVLLSHLDVVGSSHRAGPTTPSARRSRTASCGDEAP